MKSTDNILWFFSTCAQTFAALVSVFGMFVLYRLQIEEGRIGALRERMLGHDAAHLKMPLEAVLENLRNLEAASRAAGREDHAKTILTLINNHAGAMGKRRWLSRHAKNPVIWLLALTLWSLVGLVVYPYYALSPLGTYLVGFTLLLGIIPLYQVGTIIAVSLTLD